MRCKRRRTRRSSGRKCEGVNGEWPLLIVGIRSGVYGLWWVTLALTALVLLPLLLQLLRRSLRAARAIERASGDALAAAVGIAKNTAALGALDQTVTLTAQVQHTTEQLKAHSSSMAATFTERVA